jgi:membrane fusion protein (multidrug efflux system)
MSAEENRAEVRPRRRIPILLYLFGLLAVAGSVLLAFTLWSHKRAALGAEVQDRAAAADGGPRVAYITIGETKAERTVSLIGEARPFNSATLYAKVSGYLKEIRVDKGDHVTADQVLGIIESAETDHQYQAAVVDAKNKRVNAGRAVALVRDGVIPRQQADQAEADAAVAEANVAALATLKSYEVIHAPFDGLVIARYADPGALVQNAMTSQTSALPLLTVAQIDRLRVYVYPDQRDAYFIHVGDAAQISLRERPEVRLTARVARANGELDPKTRTLLTEIDFDNSGHVILPGSFVEVTLHVRPPKGSAIVIPGDAVIMRGEKPFVAVVQPDSTIHFQPVILGEDQGPFVQIVSGLVAGQRIALNLGDTVPEGGRVQASEIKTP